MIKGGNMTENKRFTVHTMLENFQVGEDDLKGHMVEILDNGNHMTYKECCNKLNALHKENQLFRRALKIAYNETKLTEQTKQSLKKIAEIAGIELGALE